MINRRNFIKQSTTALALAMSPIIASGFNRKLNKEDMTNNMILPKRLKKGDTIGLITPAAGVTKEQLDSTIKKLEKLGYKTYHTKRIFAEYGYFAGSDKERAKDVMHMFTNNNVDAILSVRGGYGTSRIVDLLDFDKIQKNPKLFMGYSDITLLHIAIYQKTGLITYHSPLGVSTFNEFSIKSLMNVIANPLSQYEFKYMREPNTEDNPEFDLYTINRGQAEGILIGGNLSLLVSMIGTEHEPDFSNKIVFIEEIEEKTYKIDKMLVQLINGSNFKDAAGIVMGVFSDCNINDKPTLTLKEAITGLIKPLKIPASYGLSFGHISTKITIPVGINAEFNATKNTLKLLEKTVI